MQVAVCPDGHNITGTLELVYGTCDFAGTVRIDQHGKVITPEYGGYTEIDWNSQLTVTREGKPVFICDNGDEIPESKLLTLKAWERKEASHANA